jgi:hypothetical protein
MGTINHGYIDRVKYELECAKLGSSIVITEPIGWNSDKKNLQEIQIMMVLFLSFPIL